MLTSRNYRCWDITQYRGDDEEEEAKKIGSVQKVNYKIFSLLCELIERKEKSIFVVQYEILGSSLGSFFILLSLLLLHLTDFNQIGSVCVSTGKTYRNS